MKTATAAEETEEFPPAINSSDLSSVSVVEQAESISTRTGAAWLCDCQRRCYGNRSICRITTALQDIWTQIYI